MWTTEATLLLGQVEATQLLGQTPVSGSRHMGTFPAKGEVYAWPGRTLSEHLGEPSWFPIPQRLVCTGESVDYRRDTESGTGRSNTAFGADPISGSRHPGMPFPARGEVSTLPQRALLDHLGEPSLVLDLSETSLCR
jgi:hypothetical protein